MLLPDLDGFEVCRRLRARSDVPIIMVTASSDSFDVVAGLEAGADDYVTKPFEPKEFTARIRACWASPGVRRQPGRIPRRRVDMIPDEGVVRVDGRRRSTSRAPSSGSCASSPAAPGRVFTREVLLELGVGLRVRGDTKFVDVHVYRLRTKIEADASEPQHLLTVRGLGYKVVA